MRRPDCMIHSVRFTYVLDTNVLYPIVIRDIIFWFAHYDMFTIKWSKHIFDEWEKVMRQKGISDEEITKRIGNAARAFPDAMVENYEPLIDGIELPDENDRHVLAAAIKTNANVIVTNDLKDFPKEYLAKYSLNVMNPDDFLADVIDLEAELAVIAFKEMVLYRTNPDMDEYQVLDSLRKNGLNKTADYLHSQL